MPEIAVITDTSCLIALSIELGIVMREINNLFDTQVNLMQLRSDSDLQIEPHAFRENDFDTDDSFVYEILQDSVELSV